MNVKLLRVARQNYCRPYIPTNLQRHNMRVWVRSLRMLGDKWLLAKNVQLTRVEPVFEDK